MVETLERPSAGVVADVSFEEAHAEEEEDNFVDAPEFSDDEVDIGDDDANRLLDPLLAPGGALDLGDQRPFDPSVLAQMAQMAQGLTKTLSAGRLQMPAPQSVQASTLEAALAGDEEAMMRHMEPMTSMLSSMFALGGGGGQAQPPSARRTREDLVAVYRSTLESFVKISQAMIDGDERTRLGIRATMCTQLPALTGAANANLVGPDGRASRILGEIALTFATGICAADADGADLLPGAMSSLISLVIGWLAQRSTLTSDQVRERCDAAVRRARQERDEGSRPPRDFEKESIGSSDEDGDGEGPACLRRACALVIVDLVTAIVAPPDETIANDPAFGDALLNSVRTARDMQNDARAHGAGFAPIFSTVLGSAFQDSQAAKEWRRDLEKGQGPARSRLDDFLQGDRRSDDPKVLRLFEAANAFRCAFASFARRLSPPAPERQRDGDAAGVSSKPRTDLKLVIADLATELSEVAGDDKAWTDRFVTGSEWVSSLRPVFVGFPERVTFSAQQFPPDSPHVLVAELLDAFIDLCAAAGETGRLHAARPLMPKGPRELKSWLARALVRASELSKFSFVLMTNPPKSDEVDFGDEAFRLVLVSAALCFVDDAFALLGLPDEDVGTKRAHASGPDEKKRCEMEPEILPVD